jgi:hypothetical protein
MLDSRRLPSRDFDELVLARVESESVQGEAVALSFVHCEHLASPYLDARLPAKRDGRRTGRSVTTVPVLAAATPWVSRRVPARVRQQLLERELVEADVTELGIVRPRRAGEDAEAHAAWSNRFPLSTPVGGEEPQADRPWICCRLGGSVVGALPSGCFRTPIEKRTPAGGGESITRQPDRGRAQGPLATTGRINARRPALSVRGRDIP